MKFRPRSKPSAENIKDAEAKAREANVKIVMHKSLEKDYLRTDADYQKWKQTLDTLENALKLSNDYVAIMERPLQAIKDEPDLLQPLIIAFLVGLGAGSIILFLFDRLDDRMNSFSEFQALFPNESILGQIPEQNSRGDVTLIRPNDDRHLYAEAFRNLRSSILFKNWKNGRPPKLILFTSAVPNEGKTTTVANLAVTMALGGARVLLADADLRRGGVNELFKVPASPGFAEVLTSKLHWRDAVLETSTKNLHILPRGEALDQTRNSSWRRSRRRFSMRWVKSMTMWSSTARRPWSPMTPPASRQKWTRFSSSSACPPPWPASPPRPWISSMTARSMSVVSS